MKMLLRPFEGLPIMKEGKLLRLLIKLMMMKMRVETKNNSKDDDV